MEISATSNSKEYSDALIRYMAAFKLNASDAIRVQGRLMGERLIKFTPPQTRQQGQDRVRKDIKKIILGLDDLADRQIPEYVLKGDTSIIKAFVNKEGVVYGVDQALYRPDATVEDLAKFHQSLRLKSGRVSDAGQATQDIGRWKFLTMMVVTNDVLNAYISSVKDRVGEAKGGWASGVIKLGGKVAQWVAIHARSAGSFIDGTKNAEPSVEFINRSEWASGGDQDRIMENAVQTRIRDIHAQIRAAARKSGAPFFK